MVTACFPNGTGASCGASSLTLPQTDSSQSHGVVGVDEKSDSSVLILMAVYLKLAKCETTLLQRSRWPCLGSALKDAKVMTVVLTSSLPKDTAHWIAPIID